MLDREDVGVDLIAHLQRIAPVDEDHGAVGEHDRDAGRTGEAGEPGEALFRRRQIFVLIAVGARDDEAGEAAPARARRAARRRAAPVAAPSPASSNVWKRASNMAGNLLAGSGRATATAPHARHAGMRGRDCCAMHKIDRIGELNAVNGLANEAMIDKIDQENTAHFAVLAMQADVYRAVAKTAILQCSIRRITDASPHFDEAWRPCMSTVTYGTAARHRRRARTGATEPARSALVGAIRRRARESRMRAAERRSAVTATSCPTRSNAPPTSSARAARISCRFVGASIEAASATQQERALRITSVVQFSSVMRRSSTSPCSR